MENPLEIARRYVGHGYDESPAAIKPDPARSRETARIYAKLAHNPNHPKVRAAYDQFKREIKAQFEHLVRSGLQIETGPDYPNSDAMRTDVARGRLRFRPTGSEMPADHPLAEIDRDTGLSYNDMFRAVHDFFGHAVHPHQFGPTGEIRAWAEHAKMFSPLARLAMTAETHGQNSWVNFGPHSHLPATERPFAEQKATVLPVTQHPTKLARGLFDRLKAAIFGRPEAGFRHGPNDGIVHKDDVVKSFAERSAVAQALQKLGLHTMDPRKHKEIVDEHTRVAAWLAHHKPDLPQVQHYRKAAEQLNVPDVVKPAPKPTPVGEFPEPPSHTYYTVPHVGPAGQDLADAARPLVTLANKLVAGVKRQPSLLDVVKEPEKRYPEQIDRPEPKPAPAEKPSLRLPPLPLAAAPRSEWDAIVKMADAGASGPEVTRELMRRYGMSPRKAAAFYTRYVQHGAQKLARRRWALQLARSGRKTDITNASVDPRIAGTRLAFHLHELAEHYKDTNPRLAEAAKRALYSSDKRPWDYTHLPNAPVSAATSGHDPDPYQTLGEELKRYTDPHGLAVRGWRDPNEPAARIGQSYNWNRVQKGLNLETAMHNFARSGVVEGGERMSDRELFDRLERGMDLHPEIRDDFFNRFFKSKKIEFKGKDAKKRRAAAMDRLHDAIRRLADRAADREEIKVGGPPPYQSDQPSKKSKWQDYFRWAQSNAHAKFSRIASVAQFLPALLEEERQAPRKDLHTLPVRQGLYDYLAADNDDPRAELLHRNAQGNVFREAIEGAGLPYNPSDTTIFSQAFGRTGRIRHSFGDGTHLEADRWSGPKGHHWAVRWTAATPAHQVISRAHMSNDEMKDWLRKFEPEVGEPIAEKAKLKLDRKSEWISAKIAKIMKDGIRGKKVSQDQAAAVAYHMWESGKHGEA